MGDIQILDEYFTLKEQNQNPQYDTDNSERINAINETIGDKSSSYAAQTSSIPLPNQNPDISELEPLAKKILDKIPQHLRIYASQAIHDFYKQIDEYEHWKSTTASLYINTLDVTNGTISLCLPEFNLEKNMPVEDDDNLDKKGDEW